MDDEKIEELYIDGIGAINLTAGTVRCDLVTFIPSTSTSNDESNPSEPKFKKIMRLITTPQGLYQAATVLQNFVKQLEEKGILKHEEPKSGEGKGKDKEKK